MDDYREQSTREGAVAADPLATQVVSPELDKDKLERYLEDLKYEQNLPMAIIAGLISAAIGAAIWATITAVTGYQIGLIAIAIGFLVGFAVRIFGKGMSMTYGIVGGLFALLACAFGNLGAGYAIVAKQLGMSFSDLSQFFTPTIAWDIFRSGFGIMDVVFYAIAVYEGYKFAFRQVSQQELMEAASS